MGWRRILSSLISPGQAACCLGCFGLATSVWISWQPLPTAGQGLPDNNSNQLLPISSYLPAPNIEPPSFRRIEQADATVAGDYLQEIMANTNDHVFRFAQMPVLIYMQPPPKSVYEQACERAWQNWQFRSGGLITFSRVDKPEEARVRIFWSHLGNAHLGADTITKFHQAIDGSQLSLASMLPVFPNKVVVPPQEIRLNLDPIQKEDAELQPMLVENLATHEIGHALGLIGHSHNRDDIMYDDVDVFSRISQRDVNTLKRLYKLKEDVAL
jgi:predicted Zn-dependent protease